MKRFFLGSFAAALAAFIWGFVFWGTPLGNPTFDKLDDAQQRAAMTALADLFPADGAYQVPGPYTVSQEEMAARTQAGPLATVHIQKAGGKFPDPLIMLGGFVHMFVAALFLATLAYFIRNKLGRGLRGIAARKTLLASFGLFSALWSNLGKPVWFHQSWNHHLWLSAYDVVAIALMAGILALIIRPDPAPAQVYPG